MISTRIRTGIAEYTVQDVGYLEDCAIADARNARSIAAQLTGQRGNGAANTLEGVKHHSGVMFLHPFVYDERSLLPLIPMFDEAMEKGKLPPAIIVIPDGSLDGHASLHKAGSFFLNSGAGRPFG